MLGIKLTGEKFRSWLGEQPCTRKVNEIILHHTWRPTASQYKGKQTIQAICDYHVREQGWGDIGYHFLIAPDGAIWAGRPVGQSGAHTRGRNAHSIGVCLIGNFDEEELTERQRLSLIIVLNALLERFKLTAEDINFHRDYAPYLSLI
ncbi:MAG: peptidoglycan recognition protein family protein, partial [Armatimonadetes bacterium]|nr:peptidoglycan recognition protein family protein [Armatimonadota bacterium]